MNLHRTFTLSLVTGAMMAVSTLSFAVTAPTTPTQPTTQQPMGSSFTSQQVQDMQKIIHDYLVNNPKVLLEASQALQKQTEEDQQQYAMEAVQKNKQQLFQDSASPVVGNPQGDVTLVEFFDYQCGHCKEMNQTIQDIVQKNKNLKIIFKELPIFGNNSQFAAQASLASVTQGKYFAFHDALLSADNPLTQDKVFEVAKKVGLNVTKLKKDMNGQAIAQQLRDNFKLAQALRLIGTPTFVISNKAMTSFKFIPGATSQQNLQDLITQVMQPNNAPSSNTSQ